MAIRVQQKQPAGFTARGIAKARDERGFGPAVCRGFGHGALGKGQRLGVEGFALIEKDGGQLHQVFGIRGRYRERLARPVHRFAPGPLGGGDPGPDPQRTRVVRLQAPDGGYRRCGARHVAGSRQHVGLRGKEFDRIGIGCQSPSDDGGRFLEPGGLIQRQGVGGAEIAGGASILDQWVEGPDRVRALPQDDLHAREPEPGGPHRGLRVDQRAEVRLRHRKVLAAFGFQRLYQDRQRRLRKDARQPFGGFQRALGGFLAG